VIVNMEIGLAIGVSGQTIAATRHGRRGRQRRLDGPTLRWASGVRVGELGLPKLGQLRLN